MPKISWPTTMDRFPAGHLIVGLLGEDTSSGLKTTRGVLERLLYRLHLKGDYALSVNRESGRAEIHCVFEREPDARKVEKALQATVMGRYPGWASQREFTLDAEMISSIKSALRDVEG